MTTLKTLLTARMLAPSLMLAMLVAAVPASADHHEKGEGDKAAQSDDAPNSQQPAELDTLQQAAKLAVMGTKRESPMLLLAAAELVKELRLSEREADDVTGQLSAKPSEGSDLPELTVDALIERAQKMAAESDSQSLKDAVAAAVTTLRDKSRGLVYRQGANLPKENLGGVTYCVLNGPSERRLDPNELYTINNAIFEANRPATVLVIGDGDGDLDLIVVDENSGIEIGRDTDTTSVCRVDWVPRYEGPFIIKVANVGRVWEEFYVLANW